MRQAILGAALGLAACGSAEPPANAAVDQPVPGVAARAQTRLFSVDSVAGACAGGVLTLQVGATANTGGWGEPVLRRISLDNGTATYEVVALPPEGSAVTMMMQMFMLKHEERDASGIRDVRVLAASNDMTAAVPGCPAAKGG